MCCCWSSHPSGQQDEDPINTQTRNRPRTTNTIHTLCLHVKACQSWWESKLGLIPVWPHHQHTGAVQSVCIDCTWNRTYYIQYIPSVGPKMNISMTERRVWVVRNIHIWILVHQMVLGSKAVSSNRTISWSTRLNSTTNKLEVWTTCNHFLWGRQ